MRNNVSKIAIALGFFDSVHLGHRALIKRTIEIAAQEGINSAVFTFSDNLYNALNLGDLMIYTYKEREQILYNLGIDRIISSRADASFMNYTPDEFLKWLSLDNTIACLVCGEDFRFGKNALGNIDYLRSYCKLNGIRLEVLRHITSEGNKISSSAIRCLITCGRIEEANALLGEPFFISGTVEKGRGVGRLLGYPTANVNIDNEKLKIGAGVYKTSVSIGSETYKSVTNAGQRPTYNDSDYKIESYIIDKGYGIDSLYGKQIKVSFRKKIRDIIKFSNNAELAEQIGKDIQSAKED